MERFLRRAYERLGPRYYLVPLIGSVFGSLFATTSAVFAMSLYFRAPMGNFLQLLAMAYLASTVSVLVSWLTLRGRILPLLQPASTERAEQSWSGLVGALIPLLRRGCVVFGIVYLFMPVVVVRMFQLRWWAGIVIYVGIALTMLWTATIIYLWIEATYRPIMLGLQASLPPDFAPATRGVGANLKMLGAATIFAASNIAVVGAIGSLDMSPIARFGTMVGAGIVASVSLAFIGNAFITRSILSSVRDMTSAAKRVDAGDLTARVPLMTGDEFGDLAFSFNKMVHGLAEREALHAALGSYVDPHIAERLLREGQLIEGEDVDATLLFLDIRGFTTMAERQDAREIVAFLNDLLGLIVPIAGRHGGHVNKFTGDGMLAVFGAPLRYDNHAQRAVAAATEIARAIEQTYPEVRIGIGLNSGRIVAGTIGGGGHLEFTVVGDAVNVAARIEELTKTTGDTILVAAATKERLGGSDLEPRGSFQLRGRTETMEVYAVSPALVD